MTTRLRAGVNDDEIWQILTDYVNAATIDALVQAELIALLEFEKSKVIKYKMASAPFDIPSTQYDKFQSCINRLKGTEKDGPLMFSRLNDDVPRVLDLSLIHI